MCGIAGFSISDKDHRVIGSRCPSRQLILQIIERGRDATGAAWTENSTGQTEVWFNKLPVPATHFLSCLGDMPVFARSAILHTRYATQGDPENNDNNHPIVVPRITGVHNGHIVNDDEIIAEYSTERTGEVDSEAIFRLLAAVENPLEHLPKLVGRAAIAWYDTDDANVLHLARLSGSPLWIAETDGGSLVFASTRGHLSEACIRAGVKVRRYEEIPEWTYLAVVKGKIESRQRFGPALVYAA